MKANALLTTAAIFLFAPEVTAQWHVGGLFGINRANTSISPEPQARDYESRIGLGLGAVVDYALSERIDVHGQLMIMGKGNTIHDEDLPEEMLWKASWVELPVLLRYIFSEMSGLRPFVGAGPALSFLRSAEFELAGDTEEDEDAESFDASIALGIGALMPWQTGTIFAELRYHHGLMNVVDSDGAFDVNNRGLMLLLGVTFPLGER